MCIRCFNFDKICISALPLSIKLQALCLAFYKCDVADVSQSLLGIYLQLGKQIFLFIQVKYLIRLMQM